MKISLFRRSGGRRRGFSLIEVAVAMALLSLAGLGSIGLLTAMSRANRDARLRGEAAALARQTVEELISLTGTALNPSGFDLALTSAGWLINGAVRETDHGTPLGTIKRRVTITSGAAGDPVPVSIRMSWGRAGGNTTLRFNISLEKPRG